MTTPDKMDPSRPSSSGSHQPSRRHHHHHQSRQPSNIDHSSLTHPVIQSQDHLQLHHQLPSNDQPSPHYHSLLSQQPPQKNLPSEIHQPPLSVIKRYRAYFTLAEVDDLVRLQSGKLAPARVEAIRQQACVFMDKVGCRLGFPRRTIGCAQMLYHRFHLFFAFADFNPYDVSIASLWLAAKLEDTLKKLREIQLAAWLVRSMAEGANGLGEPEGAALEVERARLAGIERLLLETVCFDFGAGRPAGGKDVFGFVVAIGRRMGASRALVQLAFRLAIDAHRTLVALTFPPHLIALACLYLATFLALSADDELSFDAGWESGFEADVDDIEEICHQILDLLISLCTALRSSQSPSSPSDAKPLRSSSLGVASTMASPVPDAAELTRLKIRLREIEAMRREGVEAPAQASRPVAGGAMRETDEASGDGKDWLGRDDVTVRFIFGGRETAETPEQAGSEVE